MGRYRELVRAFVSYSNATNRGVIESHRDGAFNFTQHEYQILEYICEFEDDNRIMTDISRDLGISQSNVTKATKNLLAAGMIERYRLGNNRKSIVLRPTEQGKQAYIESYSKQISPVFDRFFACLEEFSDEQLKTIERAVRILGTDWSALIEDKNEPVVLTKIDE